VNLSHVSKLKLLWKANIFLQVILFSGVKRFTLSDHKIKVVASPTQPGKGEKNSSGVKYLLPFFPILMIILSQLCNMQHL